MKRRKIIFAGVGLLGTIACGDRSSQSSQSIERLSTESIKVASANAGKVFTPTQYLKLLTPPKFKSGHTLPPLTRFGWTLPFDTRVELADLWGYALEWGPYASPDRAGTSHYANSSK